MARLYDPMFVFSPSFERQFLAPKGIVRSNVDKKVWREHLESLSDKQREVHGYPPAAQESDR